jgi:hypothetical protein
MENDWKTRPAWGGPEAASEDSGNSTVEYLRSLKRSHQGIPEPVAPKAQSPRPGGERRRNPRYKCEGSAELRAAGSTVHTWATLTDLSRSGCYLEVQATFPVDASLDMVIEVRGIRFQVKGEVRVTYPFLGMGIAFVEISNADQNRLDELLQLLASGLPARAEEPVHVESEATLPDLSKIPDPVAALDALAGHFRSSRMLTREEFVELVAHVPPSHPGQ